LNRNEKPAEVKRKRGRPRKIVPVAKPDHPIKREAPSENYFVLCNGKPVKNIRELADVMDEIEDHVFNYHVRPEHNDFAAWAKDVFQDVELAEKLAGVNDKEHLQLVVYKHIIHKLW
jgi:hypothetical protein